MDNVTISRLSRLHPKVRKDVMDSITELALIGIEFRIVQGLRTYAEQDALYASSRPPLNGPWKSDAKGGQSYHNFGLAFDFCLIHKDGSITFSLTEDVNHDKKTDFQQVIDCFKAKGWVSGADWKKKDTDHLEKTFGYTFTQMDQMVKEGKVDSAGYILI